MTIQLPTIDSAILDCIPHCTTERAEMLRTVKSAVIKHILRSGLQPCDIFHMTLTDEIQLVVSFSKKPPDPVHIELLQSQCRELILVHIPRISHSIIL